MISTGNDRYAELWCTCMILWTYNLFSIKLPGLLNYQLYLLYLSWRYVKQLLKNNITITFAEVLAQWSAYSTYNNKVSGSHPHIATRTQSLNQKIYVSLYVGVRSKCRLKYFSLLNWFSFQKWSYRELLTLKWF